MEFVALGEVAEINPRMPKGLDDSLEVSFLPMAAVSESGVVSYEEKRNLGEVKKGFTYFERGDFLIAKITPCFENGKAALTTALENKVGFGSTEFHVVRANHELLDSRYLFYLLWSEQFRFYGEKEMRGAAGQKRVSTDFLKAYKIPLPPLEEQKRIAAILDKADAIRRKRQQAIELADQFLRSVFLDMFGDPVTNPMEWGAHKFADVGKLDRGKSKHRPRNDPILLGGVHPLIQTGDVANSKGYISRYTSTYSDVGLQQSRMWPKGTLCITIAANIAKTGILEFDACFPDSVVGFDPNEKVTVEYIQYWLGFLQKILEESAPESAQKNINLEILRNLDIPVPPVNLQKKFSSAVARMKLVRAKFAEDERKIDSMFHSLSQQAFKGQLSQSKAA